MRPPKNGGFGYPGSAVNGCLFGDAFRHSEERVKLGGGRRFFPTGISHTASTESSLT